MKDYRNTNRGKNKAQASPQEATLNQAEIQRLVARATDGDFEAYGELYGTYLNRIYRYVFYQVKDKMTAEDIVEEVFVKAWKAIGSCKGKEQTFLPWLYTIAHNHVIDNFRSKKKELPMEIETITEVSDHKLEIEIKLEHQQLLNIIADLPENQRQVIILKFIDGLSNREIEQVMQKTPGAVRILQMRALAALRQRLSRRK